MALFIVLLSWLALGRGQFQDEMQDFDRSCLGEDKFRCGDDTCISQEQYCDGRMNCADGSDENFCIEHSPDPKTCAQSSHFLCADKKKCIPNHWICNSLNDCDDGSDELKCDAPQTPLSAQNKSCMGFTCDGDKCISDAWVCDGKYDCKDKSDESQKNCKGNLRRIRYVDMNLCDGIKEFSKNITKNYRCIDSSYCLPYDKMCDGMADCRDGSDEGGFCARWFTACSKGVCEGNASCVPERYGFFCACPLLNKQVYDYNTNTCKDIDECDAIKPVCSQTCMNTLGSFYCLCKPGYTLQNDVMCYANEPEKQLLFYSTKDEIGYISIQSKTQVTLATGVKQAHGVTYDGNHVFWVETAEGHQAIYKGHLDNIEGTKQVIVSLGLQDPGDLALDWLGGHIYFTDAERGMIAVCRTDGAFCTILPVITHSPKFVTLDVEQGKMYWADFFGVPLIMQARMDGTNSEVLVDRLSTVATGLTVDAASGRLYYVDKTIYVVRLDNRQVYSFFKDSFNHPYSIAVFENTVYWSDWTSRSIQTMHKLQENARSRLMDMNATVFDMHFYHPTLVKPTGNPCFFHSCSHICLISSNVTRTCACPDGMELDSSGSTCVYIKNFRPQYLVVAAGATFTKIEYNNLHNPEINSVHFNIAWVRAMAYDRVRDVLYIYDGGRKIISNINMTDFLLGVPHTVIDSGLVDVVHMDYDYVSDNLYVLDAGRKVMEVVSLKNHNRALLHRFKDEEVPMSFCIVPLYGKMLISVRDTELSTDVRIISMGLDGGNRRTIINNDLIGPHTSLQYSFMQDTIYVADEGNNIIDEMSTEGTERRTYRALSTSVMELAVTDTFVFWTDKLTHRLFWADVTSRSQRIRRIQLSIFPNDTRLHILATDQPISSLLNKSLMIHPCATNNNCSHICVQTTHGYPPRIQPTPFKMDYKCLCPPNLILVNGVCRELKECKSATQYYCHASNECIMKSKRCDGTKDCKYGEDEKGCEGILVGEHEAEVVCPENKANCYGKCIPKHWHCTLTLITNSESVLRCPDDDKFNCKNTTLCLDRSVLCNGYKDCPEHDDENPDICGTWTCLDDEFMCTTGSCIMNSFRCDGEDDCTDGSDEKNCGRKVCSVGHFMCRNKECINIKLKCDGVPNCKDNSDEVDCKEPLIESNEVDVPQCAEEEHACELNRTICIPATARCNNKSDCPSGTDELDCDDFCEPRKLFLCKQGLKCIEYKKVCDSRKDCEDGSDEIAESCAKVNRTSYIQPRTVLPRDQCRNGFLCNSSQCLEWKEVCDKTIHCSDGTDEDGQCETACKNHTCDYFCHATPSGPVCFCPEGQTLYRDGRSCVDVDECENDVCPQYCYNVRGSYLCSCYHGYALRSDHHRCKALRGEMEIVFVSSNVVQSVTVKGLPHIEYVDETSTRLTDIDIDYRRNNLYVAVPDRQKLVVVTGPDRTNVTVITNIGEPTRVAVDWVTGNVYFSDEGPDSCIRVCNVELMKCARLQRLPLMGRVKVTSLVVDPSSARMFYCVTHAGESVVWQASLSGKDIFELLYVGNCSGLAVDTFQKILYVAETGPTKLTKISYDREARFSKKVFHGQSHFDAPHNLALHEDYIYYQVGRTSQLGRCELYGAKKCTPFIVRMAHAHTFVIKQESVQRSDIVNSCVGVPCSNLCVLDAYKPLCLCNNGRIARKDGKCAVTDNNKLPLFNDSTGDTFISLFVIMVFCIFIPVATTFCIGYIVWNVCPILCCKKWKNRDRTYVGVSYRQAAAAEPTPSGSAIDSPTTLEQPDSPSVEFIETEPSTLSPRARINLRSNPLEYFRQNMRDFWHNSVRRYRRRGTPHAQPAQEFSNEPDPEPTTSTTRSPPAAFSDTESDMDEKDSRVVTSQSSLTPE